MISQNLVPSCKVSILLVLGKVFPFVRTPYFSHVESYSHPSWSQIGDNRLNIGLLIWISTIDKSLLYPENFLHPQMIYEYYGLGIIFQLVARSKQSHRFLRVNRVWRPLRVRDAYTSIWSELSHIPIMYLLIGDFRNYLSSFTKTKSSCKLFPSKNVPFKIFSLIAEDLKKYLRSRYALRPMVSNI